MQSYTMPQALRGGKAMDIVSWALVGASLIWTFIVGPALNYSTASPLFVLAWPFVIIHGLRHYGWKVLLVFWVITIVISNILENSSIMNGFPFGHYHYTGGLKIFFVPAPVGPFYVSMAYLAWHTAIAFMGRVEFNLRGSRNLILLPAVAGAVMTMIDLSFDPQASTVSEIWIWHQGGGYYGVPYTNFLGWWLTTYLFFQGFALFLAYRTPAQNPERPQAFLLQPILLYMNLGLISVVNFFMGTFGEKTIVAQNGVSWRVADLAEGTMTVFCFTMLFVTVLAISRLYDGDARRAS